MLCSTNISSPNMPFNPSSKSFTQGMNNSGRVNNNIRSSLLYYLPGLLLDSNIDLDELDTIWYSMVRPRQLAIYNGDSRFGVLLCKSSGDGCTDKTGSPRYQDFFHRASPIMLQFWV